MQWPRPRPSPTEIEEVHSAMALPGFYQQSGDKIVRETARLKELESRLAADYEQWEELEHLAENSE